MAGKTLGCQAGFWGATTPYAKLRPLAAYLLHVLIGFQKANLSLLDGCTGCWPGHEQLLWQQQQPWKSSTSRPILADCFDFLLYLQGYWSQGFSLWMAYSYFNFWFRVNKWEIKSGIRASLWIDAGSCVPSTLNAPTSPPHKTKKPNIRLWPTQVPERKPAAHRAHRAHRIWGE